MVHTLIAFMYHRPPPEVNQQTCRNTGELCAVLTSDRPEFGKFKTYLEIRKIGEDVFITL